MTKSYYYYLIVILIISITSCKNDELFYFEENIEKNAQQISSKDFPILEFSTKDEFYKTLESVNIVRSSNSFISLMDEIPNILRGSSIDEGSTYYEANEYEDLVPNKNFAKQLNPNGEIMINDTIYCINRNGTYYFPKNKFDEFKRIYQLDSLGIQVSEDLFKISEEIYRFDTFKDLDESIEIDLGVINDENYSWDLRSTGNEPNYSEFPSFKADRHTWLGGIRQGLFGNDKWYSVEMKNINKKRKVRGRLYAYHYVFYSEAGITGQMRKKNWIGWSGEPAQELRVGWRPIILSLTIPELAQINRPNIQHPVLTNVYADPYPYGTANVEWVHMLLPNDILTEQQMVTYTSKALQLTINYLKSKNSNVTGAKIKNIVMVGPSTVYHIIPDDILTGTNTKEINKVFSSNYNIMFTVNLMNLPNDVLSWINTLSGSLKQKYFKLHSGEAVICGKEENKWAGMRIVK